MVITEDKVNKLLKLYFVFVLFELFLLGSGQILKYHSATLRMANFAILNLLCAYIFKKEKIKHEYLVMIYVYLASLIVASVIGYFNGASLAAIFNDVKPLLFFIYLIPFSFLIKTNTDIDRVISVIKISAIIMAILYLLYILIFLFFPFVIFAIIPLESAGEVFFRGVGQFFFYKGFFFIMISIFLISYRTIIDKVILITLLVAIFFTLTRGFYLALIAPFLILGVINVLNSGKIKTFYLILFGFFLLMIVISLPSLINFLGDKSASDSVRLESVFNVNKSLTPLSMIIGHGFGVTEGINRVHIEVSYFEILHKQGIVGLIIWFFPLIYCFRKMIKFGTDSLDKRFFLAVISVYVLSLTNPFINNPLGLSIIVISMISMDILHQEKLRNCTNFPVVT
jgi:hypothetical protein